MQFLVPENVFAKRMRQKEDFSFVPGISNKRLFFVFAI